MTTSTHGRWVKDQPCLPHGANPATPSTQRLGEGRAALLHPPMSKPRLLPSRCIFFPPLCFTLPQKMSFFNPSLCNTSAVQAGPTCPAKLGGHTSTPPWEGHGVGAPMGAASSDAQAPGCSHAAAPSPSVDELAAERHGHTGTTGSPSLPVTHSKTSPLPAFVFTSRLGFPRRDSTQENKPPLTPSSKCACMKLIKNIPVYFF